MCMVLHLNYKTHTKNDLCVLHPIPIIADCFCCKLRWSMELYYCSMNVFHLLQLVQQKMLIQLTTMENQLNKQMHLSKHNYPEEYLFYFHYQINWMFHHS